MKYKSLNPHKSFQLIVTLSIAFVGGLLFNVFSWPIPWLLGTMTAVLFVNQLSWINLYWPVILRNTGLIIVGYSIGLTFTKDTLKLMITHLPSMAFMTILLLLICSGMAYVISRTTSINFPTALTSSIPGGLSQIITFAEETKGIDITTVTFFQVTRLIVIIFAVPFLIFSPIFSLGSPSMIPDVISAGTTSSFYPEIIPFGLFSVGIALLGKKINLPTAFLLSPILGIAALNIVGLTGPPLPASILDVSQFLIGGYIGLLLKPDKLRKKASMIPLALISGIMLVSIALILSLLLIYQFNFSFITSFLSMAPGGADQMGIIGHELEADVTMITGYQLFRILFIFFAVPPLLKWVLRSQMHNIISKNN